LSSVGSLITFFKVARRSSTKLSDKTDVNIEQKCVKT
jgi:hypothetical protein